MIKGHLTPWLAGRQPTLPLVLPSTIVGGMWRVGLALTTSDELALAASPATSLVKEKVGGLVILSPTAMHASVVVQLVVAATNGFWPM